MSDLYHDSTLDKIFLKCVKRNPVIYDLKNPNYHIPQVKQAAWVAVQQGVLQLGYNKDLNFLTKRWKYLRDYYMKLKKTQKLPIKWPYYNDVASIVEQGSKSQNSDDYDNLHNEYLSEQQPSECTALPVIVKNSIVGNANEESVDIVYEPTAGQVVIDDPLEMVIPDHAYIPQNVPENESSDNESAWTQKSHKRIRVDSDDDDDDDVDYMKRNTQKKQLNLRMQSIPLHEKTKEDIFGEFVTKMLSEMDETTKKKHMRDIIHILTS